MKTSERLRRKIKKEFPHIPYIDNVTFYRVYGQPDGVKFSWIAKDKVNRNPMLYSYDTMTDCLNQAISAVYTYERSHTPEGWMIGIK